MGSVGKKITDDILGFDKNRFLGFKKKNIANAAGKIMTPGQLKTFGKVAKVAAPVMAFTPVGAAAGAAIKKGGKGMASVLKSVGGGAGSAVGKGLGGAAKAVGNVASKVGSPVTKLISKTPVSKVATSGVSKAAKAADMLKSMKKAGNVAMSAGKKIPLSRGGYAMIGNNPLGQKGSMFAMTKKSPQQYSVRKKVQSAGIKTKGVLALFLDLPFV